MQVFSPRDIFALALGAGASDVHIAADSPVTFRIDGLLVPQNNTPLSAQDVEALIVSILRPEQYARLREQKEVDIPFSLENGVRMRINCHYERTYLGLVARIIPSDIPTVEDVDLQDIGPSLMQHDEGLILFTGPTGTGKSTSMAALLQSVNAVQPLHIVTLEDPIEFLFPKGRGIVRQRQYGQDFLSYPEALKRVLRQDPDIVMVGEMRDPETIAAALTLAETGHLVLATLHTPNAIQTVDRIIDVFPPHQQGQIRSQLSMSLRAVIAQKLLPKEGGGRIAQREVLINIPAVGNIIRDNRMAEMKSILQTNRDCGMMSFEAHAALLYKQGLISKETYEIEQSAS